jgi:hypothetical protein
MNLGGSGMRVKKFISLLALVLAVAGPLSAQVEKVVGDAQGIT